jgi:hypothetical protein
VGRVTKDQADTLLQGAFREDATTPDPSMRNPRPVAWDWIDVGRDDHTLRIEFVQGIVARLHHVEVSEGEDEVRITVFLGIDPNFRGGAVAAVGFTSWTTVRTTGPIGSRPIIDGSERL